MRSPRRRGQLGALFFALALLVSSCGLGARAPEPLLPEPATDPPSEEIPPPVVVPAAPARPHVESAAFQSDSLGRVMPFKVYVPPQYAANPARRFPTLYLLHGMGGSDEQWIQVGVTAYADRMIRAGDIAPFLIVMPEGESAYWVDHANGGPKWGAYVAVDLVKQIESTYRVETAPARRAIGGLSMGAHGALQLALNYPGTFGAVGAHSLVLRRYDSAPPYFGGPEDFAKRDPMGLVRTKPQVARSFALWVDIGKEDPWAPLAQRFDRELTDLKIVHTWHLWPGDHSGAYWSAHLTDYLRFYDAALTPRPPWDTRLRLPLAY